MSRAVITGVGVVSAFGVGASSFFGGLAEGRGAELLGLAVAFDTAELGGLVESGLRESLPRLVNTSSMRSKRAVAVVCR